MAPAYFYQQHDSILASIWNILKNFHVANFSSLPPIDTTLNLVREWLQDHFSFHPQLQTALSTVTFLDAASSSAFLRRNNIDPDDVIRLTWSLICLRPSTYELFFETLLEINESTSSQLHTTRFIQLAWTLSPILNATTVNRFSFLPSSNETNPSTTSSTTSSSKENSTPDTLVSYVSHTTAPAQSNKTLKRQLSHETITPQPLMSLQLDVNEPPLHNAPANPIPLMSFYAPPCSTKPHPQSQRRPSLQRKPRLYSTVCSQAPQANTNTSQHVTNHRPDTSSTTFNTINSPTQQQEHATVFSPNHDQPSPGLSSAF
ncbi:unnamed protein product, partial [Rotaria sp. Silwood2]